jgi:DNA-binding response OmpR family regulator
MLKDTSRTLCILVVEDDLRLLDLLCHGLRELGHTVMPASDGQAGQELALRFDFDVIVLDIGLPSRDGYEVTRSLRGSKRSVPILMLTARDAEDDIIRGFDTGADDYLLKPFSFLELVARLQGLTRLSRRGQDLPLVLDHARLIAIRDGIPIQLTRTEFLLLQLLVDKAGSTVPRQEIIQTIWGGAHVIQSNTLVVLVNSLRSKLDLPFETKMILTIRGSGYRLQLNAEIVPSTAPRAEDRGLIA